MAVKKKAAKGKSSRSKAKSKKTKVPALAENRLRDEGVGFSPDEQAVENSAIEEKNEALTPDHNDKYPESHMLSDRRGVEKKDPDGSARPL